MTPVITLATAAWRAVIPLAFVLLGGAIGPVAIVIGGVVLLFLAVGFGAMYLSWQRRTYEVRDGALIVESGIISRSRREVPLGRIQQIDVRRNLVQRVFGLSALHVDTASGGSGAEVVLASLDDATSNSLRDLLLAGSRAANVSATEGHAPGPVPRAPGDAPPPPPPWAGTVAHEPPATRLVHLEVPELILAGITGKGLGVGLGLLAAAVGFGLEASVVDAEDAATGGAALGILAIGAVAVAMIGGVIATVLADHDLTVTRVGDEIHMRRGLLEQRETTIALHRIQAVRIQENPIRRLLGRCSIELQNAGSGGSAGGGEQVQLDDSRISIPLLRVEDVPDLLRHLLPFDTAVPPIEPAPAVARRRRLLRAGSFAAAILIAGGVVAAAADEPVAFVVPLFLAAVVLALGEASFRALGSALGADLVVARSGPVVRSTAIVPMARLQSVGLDRSLLQRRVGIGTLRLCVAGSGTTPEVIDVDMDRLRQMREAALFDDTTRADERRARDRIRRAARSALPAAAV